MEQLLSDGHPALSIAAESDVDEIFALYRSLFGLPGCTWNEEYPPREFLLEDAQNGVLFCLRAPDGAIYAAAAAPAADELDGLAFPGAFYAPCELERVGVRRDKQHTGTGRALVTRVLNEMRSRGNDCCRLLVSPGNAAARALYAGLGFADCGETDLYGQHWIYAQRAL